MQLLFNSQYSATLVGGVRTHACTPHYDLHVISQIYPGYVHNSTAGNIFAFYYRPCHDCGNLINSVYYKEYLQTDQDSASVLQQVSKIVCSSTDFRQIAGCVQFSAKWAFVVTWIEAGDGYGFDVVSQWPASAILYSNYSNAM